MIRTMAVVLGSLLVAFPVGAAPHAAADPSQYLMRTESGKMRCILHRGHVACSPAGPGGFPQAPISPSGSHDNVASVDGSRAFQLEWASANLPGSNPADDTILMYGQTYHLLGWTILPTSDGTRFTDDGTGHGMFVSVENVYSF